MSFEGLPGSFVAAFCGGAPPCLVKISGIAREVLVEMEPPKILQATR
jgi:hypothetical protein